MVVEALVLTEPIVTGEKLMLQRLSAFLLKNSSLPVQEQRTDRKKNNNNGCFIIFCFIDRFLLQDTEYLQNLQSMDL